MHDTELGVVHFAVIVVVFHSSWSFSPTFNSMLVLRRRQERTLACIQWWYEKGTLVSVLPLRWRNDFGKNEPRRCEDVGEDSVVQ